jgi:uncharacterized repeat protein (TIGR01451 family)
MNRVYTTTAVESRMPQWRRFLLVAACTLVLCSCQSDQSVRLAKRASAPSPSDSPALPREPNAQNGAPSNDIQATVARRDSVPQNAGVIQQVAADEPLATPPDAPMPSLPGAVAPGYEHGVPLPDVPTGPWAPPGISRPWPTDEYIADGGDNGLPAGVSTVDGHLAGVGMEDTIAHYDTLDGRTLVEPSNRVSIYSPKFRSVRQVMNLYETGQMDRTVGALAPVKVAGNRETLFAASSKQNEQLVGRVGKKSLTTYRSKEGEGLLSASLGPHSFQDGFRPYENCETIRLGKYQSKEHALLLRGTTAAKTWEHKAAVQVFIDEMVASAVTRNEQVQVTYTIKEPPANPKLQITKVASTQYANPGETIDFTLRFDNVGNQTIGNVTIVDNLTTRLEYVPDSAQSSVPADFSHKANEGDSLVLRWEVKKPLKPGEGGIVRFTCRVR